MRNQVIGIVLFFGSAGFVMGQAATPPAGTEEPVKTTHEAEAEQVLPPGDAVALLLKPVAKIDWDEKPFEEILDWLRDEGDNRVNILPKWLALNNEGVDQEKAVTLKMTNSTVAKVLNEVFEQLSEEGRLRYYATENAIRITTQLDAERKLVTRVYNVADILFQIPNFSQEAPQIDLTGQNQGGGGGGQGGGASGSQQGIFATGGGGQQGQQQGEENEQQQEMAANRLRDIIILTIFPESWEDTPTQQGGGGQVGPGGGRGRIRVYNRALIVYNTIEVHEQIAGWQSANQ